jgi:hypothetical protein
LSVVGGRRNAFRLLSADPYFNNSRNLVALRTALPSPSLLK